MGQICGKANTKLPEALQQINPNPIPPQQLQEVQTLDFYVEDCQIKFNGQQFHLKGIAWFGFECTSRCVYGLDYNKMEEYLDLLKNYGFNAIRLPFACDLALNLDSTYPNGINMSLNPHLKGRTSGQVMDHLIQQCSLRGILVMPDMHRLHEHKQSELWYDNKLNEESLLKGWLNILTRFSKYWNVFAVDLFNEPHDLVTWGDGNIQSDWCMAASRIGNYLLAANPNLLIFVEGIDKHKIRDGFEDHGNWGVQLQGIKKSPVKLINNKKLVYSPHAYGPEVCEQQVDPKGWQNRFGFIKTQKLGAVCVGEWGGLSLDSSQDKGFQINFSEWLLVNKITDNFYWCLNPNSNDTGGFLMDDWKTVDDFKADILDKINPHPTLIKIITESQIQINGQTIYINDISE